MKSRYVVLFLSVVLALALAVPALGGPTNPVASVSATIKQTANKALKKAKTAQATANSAAAAAAAAQSSADAANKAAGTAGTTAKGAQTTATAAQNAAKTAQTTADGAKAAAATAQTAANAAKAAADAAQATANTKFGNTETTYGTSSPITNTASKSDFVICPSGEQVTGGGFEVTGTGANDVVPTYNNSYGDAWITILDRVTGAPANTWGLRVAVICAGA
jgi:hypothetical protein